MKPFDPTGHCDKCGNSGAANVVYHRANDGSCNEHEPLEHAHYTCNICKASWMTTTADANA